MLLADIGRGCRLELWAAEKLLIPGVPSVRGSSVGNPLVPEAAASLRCPPRKAGMIDSRQVCEKHQINLQVTNTHCESRDELQGIPGLDFPLPPVLYQSGTTFKQSLGLYAAFGISPRGHPRGASFGPRPDAPHRLLHAVSAICVPSLQRLAACGLQVPYLEENHPLLFWRLSCYLIINSTGICLKISHPGVRLQAVMSKLGLVLTPPGIYIRRSYSVRRGKPRSTAQARGIPPFKERYRSAD